ncbi:MAG: Holliday junction branch migration protein RuvA [Dysosmobacter welbionis]
MFYYLDGTVAEILPYLAVIDCGGVGYACKTTNTTLAQLKKGQRGKLYTYLDVGENAFGLYGFATANELNSFKLLIGVSGVGPKAALAILSAATPESLAMAIVTGDEKSLTAAPGVGKKIAQRNILELKDKMARESAATGLDFSGGGCAVPAFTNKATEAAQALAVRATPAPRCPGAEGRGRGNSVSGGDHPPVPEKDGEVSMKILSGFCSWPRWPWPFLP